MQLEGKKKKKRQLCYANFPDNWINLQNLELCTVGIGYILVGRYVFSWQNGFPTVLTPLCECGGVGGML